MATKEADFCLAIFEPITWADADTDQTIEQVKKHNAEVTELRLRASK